MEDLEGSRLWEKFDKEFLSTAGVHCLSLGQTGTGKTIKSFQFIKWLIEKKETIVFFDTGKSGEMLPLLGLGLPLRCIIPSLCSMSFVNSPVKYDIETVIEPTETWDFVLPNRINVLGFRNYFVDAQPKSKYGSDLIHSLVIAARQGKLPRPLTLVVDEFHELCPSYGLMENKYLKESASRTTVALKTLRSEGIRIIAIDQAWGDIFSNARRQFPFILSSRSPSFGKDAGRLAAFPFHDLRIEYGRLIFPQREWAGTWKFPMYYPPPKAWVTYHGEVIQHKAKHKVVETWQKVVVDDTG
jgi:hypothetical protein